MNETGSFCTRRGTLSGGDVTLLLPTGTVLLCSMEHCFLA